MIKCDTHIHSNHSEDSKIMIDDICIAAIKSSIKVICITDHVDFDTRDYGFGYYNHEKYFCEFNRCKKKYKSKLILLSGIEFSEPHLHQMEFKNLSKFKYDMIMGSAHWISEGFIGEREVINQYTIRELENIYYKVIIDAINFGGFDTFAHLDLFKRYTKNLSSNLNLYLEDICNLLVSKDIALEIDSSSLRKGKGVSEYMPSDEIIELYIKRGGRKITVGSDAHFIEEIGKDLDSIIRKYKKFVGVFINRKFVYLNEL